MYTQARAARRPPVGAVASFAHTNALRSRPVSAVIRVLNAPGGPGLMEEYFGPNSGGTGTLATFGGQYDFSLGNSRYFNGSNATTVWGAPPVRDPNRRLDENVVSLTASMWW